MSDKPKVEYDVIPFPPDWLMVEVKKEPTPEAVLEMSPLYTGVDIPK